MFQFHVEHGHPDRDAAGKYLGWIVDSSDRYTVTTWPGRPDLIGIQREKNTFRNDPPQSWPNFEKKAFRVVPDFEYCYKLQKTQIRARGGAEGLYNFIKKEIEENEASVFARRIVEYAMDEMREARTA